jgi:hypothetical protein
MIPLSLLIALFSKDTISEEVSDPFRTKIQEIDLEEQ